MVVICELYHKMNREGEYLFKECCGLIFFCSLLDYEFFELQIIVLLRLYHK